MIFSTIYGEVAANFPTANVNRCKQAVNSAYHEFMSAREWSFRESSMAAIPLVAGTATFTLLGTTPVVTDFDGMIDVVIERTTGGDRDALIELLQGDFDRVFGKCTTNGDPVAYCIRGGAPNSTSATIVQGGQQQLAISPPPIATAGHGQNLILRYFRSVGSMELSGDNDVPLIPTQYQEALILGGNAYMAASVGANLQKAQNWRTLFKERVQEASAADMGQRGKDRQLMVFAPGAMVYPITGQSPATWSPETRPYDQRAS